jgi:hypothetical protein
MEATVQQQQQQQQTQQQQQQQRLVFLMISTKPQGQVKCVLFFMSGAAKNVTYSERQNPGF